MGTNGPLGTRVVALSVKGSFPSHCALRYGGNALSLWQGRMYLRHRGDRRAHPRPFRLQQRPSWRKFQRRILPRSATRRSRFIGSVLSEETRCPEVSWRMMPPSSATWRFTVQRWIALSSILRALFCRANTFLLLASFSTPTRYLCSIRTTNDKSGSTSSALQTERLDPANREPEVPVCETLLPSRVGY